VLKGELFQLNDIVEDASANKDRYQFQSIDSVQWKCKRRDGNKVFGF